MITSLRPDEMFVFGSNILGLHMGGAALQAKEFGAEDGVGEGITGQCYAFPTLGENMEKRTEKQLLESRELLYATACAYPDKTFLLTKVGCGIAGYEESFMKSLFKEAPENIQKPIDWK